MQANFGETEIKALLQKVKIFNKEIGSYQVFAITENFNYVLKLSNGRILIKVEELIDNERAALTPDRLTAIASRFISSTSKTTTNDKSSAPLPKTPPQTGTQRRRSAIGKIVLMATIALVVLGGFMIFININNSGGYGSEESYHEKVMTIEEIERLQPTNFLSADGSYRETFWGDKIKVNCVITNRATVATYKDAIVKITYYTKTKTELGSKEYSVYEVFPPNSTKAIELKIDNYKDVNSIGWEVISALPY